jgi:hypothetical protein
MSLKLSFRNFEINKMLFLAVIIIFYVSTFNLHEPWRDEYLHFILVRDYSFNYILQYALPYEGMPPFFYFLIYFFISFFGVFGAVKYFILTTTILIFILLYKKIKNSYLFFITCLTNPLFYTFGFFSRFYQIYILLILLFYLSNNSYLKITILVLLNITGIQGLVLSFSLIISNINYFIKRINLINFSLVLISAGICVYYIFPRPDRTWNVIVLANLTNKKLIWLKLLMFGNIIFLFFLFISRKTIFLKSNRERFFLFTSVSFISISLLNILSTHVSQRHIETGFIFLYPGVFIFQESIVNSYKKNKLLFILCAFFILRNTYSYVKKDVLSLFSDSINVSNYIKSNIPRDNVISVYPDYCAHTIAAQIPNKIFLIKNNMFGTYYILKNKNSYQFNDISQLQEKNEIKKRVQKNSIKILVLITSFNSKDLYKAMFKEYKLLYETEQESISDENFLIFDTGTIL